MLSRFKQMQGSIKMCKLISFSATMFIVATVAAQTTPIPIPPVLSGSNISLTLQNGTTSFYNGFNTATNGYNGNYLGPTLVLQSGQSVTIDVANMLGDTTTTHWHGLHVAPINDGSPHNLIMDGATWSPSFTVMDKAATYWYHPHLHGKTMEQVIKGASGFIIVQDNEEAALALPRTYGVDDFPIAFQFQTFNNVTKQLVMNDELDNAVLINGVVSNASINVPAQIVRLRLLNASSHRFFMFGFNDNRTFHQITSDAGLLNTGIPLTRLQLASGERAEILVDFSGQQGSTFFLKQYGTQLPAGYPGGPPDNMGMMQLGPLDNTNFDLLQFNVISPTTNPITTLPTTLTTNLVTSTAGATTKNFLLQGSPMMSMTDFNINGMQYNDNVMNFITQQDAVMIWNITNQSMMPHPWHIHGNHFYIQSINNAAPPLNMRGRKDVVTVPPQGGNVKLIMKYEDFADSDMPYMYHCHILSHEDNGMMGQFIVTPNVTATAPINIERNISISPNPLSLGHSLRIAAEDDIREVHVINSVGQVVLSFSANKKQMDIDLSLIKGEYYIQVLTQNNILTQKIIIQ